MVADPCSAPYKIQNPSEPPNTPKLHSESSPETNRQKFPRKKLQKIPDFFCVYFSLFFFFFSDFGFGRGFGCILGCIVGLRGVLYAVGGAGDCNHKAKVGALAQSDAPRGRWKRGHQQRQKPENEESQHKLNLENPNLLK